MRKVNTMSEKPWFEHEGFNFAKFLADGMKSRNITPDAMAYMTGLSRASIDGYTKGKQSPTLFSVEQVLRVFRQHIVIIDDDDLPF